MWAAHLKEVEGAHDVLRGCHGLAHEGGGRIQFPACVLVITLVIGLPADCVHRQGLGGGLAGGVREGGHVSGHHAALLPTACCIHDVHGTGVVALAHLVGTARAVVVPEVCVQNLDDLVAGGAVEVHGLALSSRVAHQADDAIVHQGRRVLGNVAVALIEAVVRHQLLGGAGAVRHIAHECRAVRVGRKVLRFANLTVHHHVVNLSSKVLANTHWLRVAAAILGRLVGEGGSPHLPCVEVQVEVEPVIGHRHVRPLGRVQSDGIQSPADAENLGADVHTTLQGVLARHAGRGQQRQPVALARVLRLLRKDVLTCLARVRSLLDVRIDGEVAIQVEHVHVGEHGGHRHCPEVQRGAVVHREAVVAAAAVGILGRFRKGAVLIVRLGAAAAGVSTRSAHRLAGHAHLVAVVARNVRRVTEGVSTILVVRPLAVEVLGAIDLKGPVGDAALGAQIAEHVDGLERELDRHAGHGLISLVKVQGIVQVVEDVGHAGVRDVRVHVGLELFD
mmetsp:Transcript_33634/g.73408  ORF Transcript_33634/g.73408 Transcript_33634/m.73408 type:complete len:505 (-) Transcript_33634:11015-12529(-)